MSEKSETGLLHLRDDTGQWVDTGVLATATPMFDPQDDISDTPVHLWNAALPKVELEIRNISPQAKTILGGGDSPSRVGIKIDGATSKAPIPPRKSRKCQGKRYRIARRHYRREFRKWVRTGEPRMGWSIEFPDVTITEYDADHRTFTGQTHRPFWVGFHVGASQ